jgi:ubiquinone/menaquinone biosynthesis C-methylase UbiE
MEADRTEAEYRMILKHADLKGKRVLEVGCGSGRASALLAREAGELIAIDPDPELIKTARQEIPAVDFRVGTGEHLEFPDGVFDAVAFTFSLHHQDSSRALSEAYRVLRPGGLVIIIEPSVEGEIHRFFRAFRDEDRQITEALAAIKNSPFTVLGTETFSIEWRFDDCEDLYFHFLEHAKTPKTDGWIKKMESLLGTKVRDSPLLLNETVTIFSLAKESD